MCDQTIPYKVGDLVWVMIVQRIWWPGIVTEASKTPEAYQEFISSKKFLVIVHFPRDNSFEAVNNLNKIFMYNSNRKLEFLKKGYMLYKKQMKSKVVKVFDMVPFIDDVLNFEKQIGGDLNIFKQFEEEIVPPPPLVDYKEIFPTGKTKKNKAKNTFPVRGRQSLPAPKTSTSSITNKKPSTPKAKPVATTLSIGNASTNKGFACYFDSPKKCLFTTLRYEHLKRHMAEHKAQAELMKKSATSSSSSNTNIPGGSSPPSVKRKIVKSRKSNARKSYTKKIKLHDELLKEWEFDEAEVASDNASEDGDKQTVDSVNTDEDNAKDEDKKDLDSGNADEGKAKDEDKKDLDSVNTDEDKAKDEDKKDLDSVNTDEDKAKDEDKKDLDSINTDEDKAKDENKKDLDSGNTDEGKAKDEDKKDLDTNTIEGEENDTDKSSVVDEKNDKDEDEKSVLDSNTNQVKNVVEDKSQDTSFVQDKNVEKDIITIAKTSTPHTIFDFDEDDGSNFIPDLRPSKSDPNCTTEDEINESFDRNGDQEFATSIIFGSTSSQPPVEKFDEDNRHSNNFENEIESSKLLLKKTVNTLDQISNLEESMNNISTSGNQLIGDDESSVSLNEISYLNKDLNHPENEAMVKTNVNAGDYLVTSPKKMQQSNDKEESSTNYLEIDDEKEKLCSNVDSTQLQNNDSEEIADPTENGRYECLLDGLPSPDWIKEDSWESFPDNGLQEAMELLTIDTYHQLDFLSLDSLEPSIIDIPFEPTVVHKFGEYELPLATRKRIRVRVPYDSEEKVIPTEELLEMPEIKECLEHQNSGSADADWTLEFREGSYVVEEEEQN